jgi:plastocyanin
MKRGTLIVLMACLLGCAAVVPAASGSGSSTPEKPKKPVVKNVQVVDDAYLPAKETVKKGNQINWIWNRNNFDTHTVTLIKGPKGVNKKKFSSIEASTGIHFKLTFLKPGTYHFQCMLHPFDMNMTVTVKN